MKIDYYNNKKIIIGQNASENWDIIDFKSDNIWLHLNSFPSCHVIIEDKSPPEEVINYAAMLCKENTKYRNLKNLKINYTHINNLRKVGKEGTVEFISNRKVSTITV